jgi:hypothetical protein
LKTSVCSNGVVWVGIALRNVANVSFLLYFVGNGLEDLRCVVIGGLSWEFTLRNIANVSFFNCFNKKVANGVFVYFLDFDGLFVMR